jgi:type IV secretion system protein VirB11
VNAIVKLDERRLAFLREAMGEALLALLQDDEVAEVILNPDGNLWALTPSGAKQCLGGILSGAQAETLIRIVADFNHGEVHDERPIVSAMLPDSGARFEGLLPPVVKQPSFSIRKHLPLVLGLEDYVRQDVLSESLATRLKMAVRARKNIVVSGATFSGKTTFANALLNEVAKTGDRVLIAEDTPELQCSAEDCFTMQTSETVSMRVLVKSMMRLNPDRIVIGEVRDGSALDLLKAWGTHGGGIATVHSRSAAHALERLGMLIQEVVPVIPKALIGEAVDIIVQIECVNGLRKVKELAQVHGYDAQHDRYVIESTEAT